MSCYLAITELAELTAWLRDLVMFVRRVPWRVRRQRRRWLWRHALQLHLQMFDLASMISHCLLSAFIGKIALLEYSHALYWL